MGIVANKVVLDKIFGLLHQRKEKKTNAEPGYDKTTQKPVIHASICTGEQVAGFKDLSTGKFTEIMLIRSPKDLNQFMEQYGIEKDQITKEY